MVISVALDKSVADAAPWIRKARATHPSLIDSEHLVADLYNIVNVPTGLWINETGHIVLPNDVIFGSNKFKALTGVNAKKHLQAIRDWVLMDKLPISAAQRRAMTMLPTAEMQQARAEFSLGQRLFERGFQEDAETHFQTAGELAPHDFTIRRGTMPMRGINPMGPQFMKMTREWSKQGNDYYEPLDW